MEARNTRGLVRSLLVCAAGAAVGLSALPTSGQCLLQRETAGSLTTAGYYGCAVAISPSWTPGVPVILTGAWGDDTPTYTLSGAAYAKLSANITQVIMASNAQPGDLFGTSVDLDFPLAAIGAPGYGAAGGAYIFEYFGPTFAQTAILSPAGGSSGDDFGRSVAATLDGGGWVAVGMPGVDIDFNATAGDSDPNAGKVALYKREAGSWAAAGTLPLRITFPGGGGAWANERFGEAVAMRGTTLVCGAPHAGASGVPDRGIVDIYELVSGSWVSQGRFAGTNGQTGDLFGAAVSVDGAIIAVGAPGDDATAAELPGLGAKTDSGAVHIYRWASGAWALEAVVWAEDASDDAEFGSSVSVSGSSVLIGAKGAKKAYLFERDLATGAWSQKSAYSDPDSPADGGFANSVALSGSTVVIGDWLDDQPAQGLTNQGAMYVGSAQLESDSCGGAERIAEFGTYAGCTRNATLSGTTTCGGGGAGGYGPDVWLKWKAPCSGPVVMDTIGSSYDTVLSVHSGCPGTGANTLACNDDGGGIGLASRLTLNAAAGVEYLVRVSGFNGLSGDFTLNVTPGNPPANDTCAGAQNVGVGSHAFANCNAASNGLVGGTCAANGGADPVRDVWFRYTAAQSGTVTVSTCGSAFDTVLQVWADTGFCPILNTFALACDDDSPSGHDCAGNSVASWLQFQATAGQAYHIRVGAWNYPAQNDDQETGDGVLTIALTPSCPADFNSSGTVTVQDIYDFLSDWNSQVAGGAVILRSADFNGAGGVTVQDIYDFLAAWNAGCP